MRGWTNTSNQRQRPTLEEDYTLYRTKQKAHPAGSLLRGGSPSILPGGRWPEGRLTPARPRNPGLEREIARSEQSHKRRRIGSRRVYRFVERLFFLAMIVFVILAFRRFFSAVAPAFMG